MEQSSVHDLSIPSDDRPVAHNQSPTKRRKKIDQGSVMDAASIVEQFKERSESVEYRMWQALSDNDPIANGLKLVT